VLYQGCRRMKKLEEVLPASSYLLKTKLVTLAAFVLPLISLVLLSNSLNAQSNKSEFDGANLLMDDTAGSVKGLQADFGPYDYRLLEPLDDQGELQQRMGDHEGAVRTFKQALHLTRINNGLHHESQIDVLDKLIASERVLRNWQDVDNHYAYMQHLYQRLYGIDDSRLEAGLQKVASWHVSAFNVDLDGKRIEHLQTANKLFHLRLKVAKLTLSADDPKFDFLYRNIALCERQLYLASGLNKEMMHRQEKIRRDRNSSRNPQLAELDGF